MSRKKVFTILAITLVLISLKITVTGCKRQQPLELSQTAKLENTSFEATMHTVPSTTIAEVSQVVSVDICVSNVTDLYGWEFKLKWNSTLIDALNITEGNFLRSQNDTLFVVSMNNTEGYLRAACTLIGNLQGVDGSGALAIIEFETENAGECDFDLYDTKLVNSSEQSINHTVIDGQMKILSFYRSARTDGNIRKSFMKSYR